MHDVRTTLTSIHPVNLVLLGLLWAAGLFAHSFVLTGALPGLTRRRALTLNLTGSATSNVLPFGGAAGMALNYVMVRTWGVGVTDFAVYTFVTNVWVVLVKLALPLLVLAGVLASGAALADPTVLVSVATGATIALLGLCVVLGLAGRRAATIVSRLAARAYRMLGRPVDEEAWDNALENAHRSVSEVIGKRWAQLSVGMFGYAALQAGLLWACCEVVGAQLSVSEVLAAYAVERLLTLITLTPGAAGVAEAGTAGVLMAAGGTPSTVVAAVLLYRAFTYALEIPVGGVWLGAWLLVRRRNQRAESVMAGVA